MEVIDSVKNASGFPYFKVAQWMEIVYNKLGSKLKTNDDLYIKIKDLCKNAVKW